jgi:hypothetical protein
MTNLTQTDDRTAEWLARHPPDWSVIAAARAERGLPPEPWPLP